MISLLKKYFGYENFRPLQEKVIGNVLEKRDALVLMPTGGGKSLCYQLPAMVFSGLTLVISPLIALMKDQVDALKTNGIAAEFINSTLSANEIVGIQRKIERGEVKICYLSPERLAVPGFMSWLASIEVNLIAVDEAHCISEWGHDFRPEYRNLKNLRDNFPSVPVVALTATATEKVKKDIIDQLRLKDGSTYISSFNRPNLHYQVQPKKNTFGKLLHFLQKYQGEPAIVYCFSRKETEKLAEKLCQKGYAAAPYNAGLDADERKLTQEKFIRDDISIIVATTAFGMGIDKPDIRLIAHYSLPKSVEGYYQETGRAGRDGLPAECVLFYSYGDKLKYDYFVNQIEDLKERANVQKKMFAMIDYCKAQYCRRKFLLSYFGEKCEIKNCENCDFCKPGEVLAEVVEKRIRPPKLFREKKQVTDLKYDEVLYEKLRMFRKRIAERLDVPPFVVFSNVSLQEMACYLPRDLESFEKINGVGKEKLRKFGKVFVHHIGNYMDEKGF